MAIYVTTASALDSASGSVLSSEALSAYAKHTQYRQNNRGAKLTWAESGAEVVDSKRAIIYDYSMLQKSHVIQIEKYKL